MANSWHVNPNTGNPGRCRVDWNNPSSRGCPFGAEYEHFESATDAVNHYAERRDQLEDPFGSATLTAAQRDLAELRKADGLRPKAPDAQYISEEVGKRSFWGRNGKKIGGAVVAAFALTTITSLVLNGGVVQEADGIAPQGDASLQEPVQEGYADVLPEETPQEPSDPAAPQEQPAPQEPGAREYGEAVGDTLQETADRLKDEVTPERVEKLKDAGESVRDFISGLVDSYGPTVSVPVEATPGTLFQGRNLQPSSEEIAAAQATLDSLELKEENKEAYYNRVEQFGRSFETGVVGKLEHRDIPEATFKNAAPQARAIAGGFIDPYTGERVEIVKGSSTDTDVDHIVPLHEVIESESSSKPLSAGDRIAIANDFENLQIVGSSVNRSKGDRDPGEWMPPNSSSHLRYAIATINVKSKYGLTVDQAEYDVLAQVLAARQ